MCGGGAADAVTSGCASHSQSPIANVRDARIVISRVCGITVCRYPMRLSLASEDLLEQAALKRSIASKFATLSDAYKYHCGHSLVADGGCPMRYSELRHLLDVCGALNTAREQTALDRVFTKIASNKELADGDPKCVASRCIVAVDINISADPMSMSMWMSMWMSTSLWLLRPGVPSCLVVVAMLSLSLSVATCMLWSLFVLLLSLPCLADAVGAMAVVRSHLVSRFEFVEVAIMVSRHRFSVDKRTEPPTQIDPATSLDVRC